MISPLLVKPHAPDAAGCVTDITPASAGWRYVGFRVIKLAAGQRYEACETAREACLVILSGNASITAAEQTFDNVGERNSVFDGSPASIYLPAFTHYAINANTPLEVAICTAPGTGAGVPRLIAPDQVGDEVRGTGTNQRHVRNILPDTQPAESLLVVEVITPAGHWSSYPPHKHDRDLLPTESHLEETYYHRLNPAQGFAFQRVYTDDRSLDETMSVEDGDTVMVPRGYHPVGTPHGYELYYLNVMAGPRRSWVFKNDPAHEWIIRK